MLHFLLMSGRNLVPLLALLDAGDGSVEFTTIGETLTITINSPAKYAGVYTVSADDVRNAPVCIVPPPVSRVDDELISDMGVWVIDSSRVFNRSRVWVIDGLEGNETTLIYSIDPSLDAGKEILHREIGRYDAEPVVQADSDSITIENTEPSVTVQASLSLSSTTPTTHTYELTRATFAGDYSSITLAATYNGATVENTGTSQVPLYLTTRLYANTTLAIAETAVATSAEADDAVSNASVEVPSAMADMEVGNSGEAVEYAYLTSSPIDHSGGVVAWQ